MNKLLTPLDTVRWVVKKKALLVKAIEDRVLSFDDACTIYNISKDELTRWFDLFKDHGIEGLRATRIQDYREAA